MAAAQANKNALQTQVLSKDSTQVQSKDTEHNQHAEPCDALEPDNCAWIELKYSRLTQCTRCGRVETTTRERVMPENCGRHEATICGQVLTESDERLKPRTSKPVVSGIQKGVGNKTDEGDSAEALGPVQSQFWIRVEPAKWGNHTGNTASQSPCSEVKSKQEPCFARLPNIAKKTGKMFARKQNHGHRKNRLVDEEWPRYHPDGCRHHQELAACRCYRLLNQVLGYLATDDVVRYSSRNPSPPCYGDCHCNDDMGHMGRHQMGHHHIDHDNKVHHPMYLNDMGHHQRGHRHRDRNNMGHYHMGHIDMGHHDLCRYGMVHHHYGRNMYGKLFQSSPYMRCTEDGQKTSERKR